MTTGRINQVAFLPTSRRPHGPRPRRARPSPARSAERITYRGKQEGRRPPVHTGSSASERTSTGRAPDSRTTPGGTRGEQERGRGYEARPATHPLGARRWAGATHRGTTQTAFGTGTQRKKPTSAVSTLDAGRYAPKRPSRDAVAARAGTRRTLASRPPLTRPPVRSARPCAPPARPHDARGHREGPRPRARTAGTAPTGAETNRNHRISRHTPRPAVNAPSPAAPDLLDPAQTPPRR